MLDISDCGESECLSWCPWLHSWAAISRWKSHRRVACFDKSVSPAIRTFGIDVDEVRNSGARIFTLF